MSCFSILVKKKKIDSSVSDCLVSFRHLPSRPDYRLAAGPGIKKQERSLAMPGLPSLITSRLIASRMID